MTGIKKIIEAAGGQVLLAEAEGVTQQAVSLWATQGWVPLRRAMSLSKRYGVPAIELVHPDVRQVLG